jgi:hypothetical protein
MIDINHLERRKMEAILEVVGSALHIWKIQIQLVQIKKRNEVVNAVSIS